MALRSFSRLSEFYQVFGLPCTVSVGQRKERHNGIDLMTEMSDEVTHAKHTAVAETPPSIWQDHVHRKLIDS
jgi:hypothetical protein